MQAILHLTDYVSSNSYMKLCLLSKLGNFIFSLIKKLLGHWRLVLHCCELQIHILLISFFNIKYYFSKNSEQVFCNVTNNNICDKNDISFYLWKRCVHVVNCPLIVPQTPWKQEILESAQGLTAVKALFWAMDIIGIDHADTWYVTKSSTRAQLTVRVQVN